MNQFFAEFFGTAMILCLGSGVVANVLLNKTKGHNGGWIVITTGWAIGVFTGVLIAADVSGAHLNPAVTLALVLAGKFSASLMPMYIAAQMLGAMFGSTLAWLAYKKHFDATDDADYKLAVFSTIPNIRGYWYNLVTEIIGTYILALAVLYMAAPDVGLGALNALPVALVVLGIGVSLGGPTGYAINPARDLGPRIMHFILPVPGKRDSDWKYSWVPVVGPMIGAALAAWMFVLFGGA
ncbi:MAG TPA: MIP/aquaporin family protein [Bacteroidales bacterium]|nr:MIP/aquaporin family protein [Bacteroidales bacterium]HOS72849.1 MIP/aquaporin family protein [Bacteroidales bacterium]HQH25445.1 MIP/aquaporin family protein [Bacteroidales bacterium]